MKHVYLLAAMALSTVGVSAQYCTSGGPTYTSDSNVETVDLTGDNTSINYVGCSPAVAGVEDQTAMTADVMGGGSYSVDITFGTCGSSYPGAGEAWIDYDQNGTFDPSESIGTWSGSPSQLVTFNFTVPGSAALGQTRMRVMQDEGGATPLDPCGSFSWGSVTDFSILITGPCMPATNLNATNITTTSADLGWTAGGSETVWNVEWGAPAFTPGTGAEIGSDLMTSSNPTSATGLMQLTDYEFYVQGVCGSGSPLIVTGVIDGPLGGGTPKAVELFVVQDIADLSMYGISSANNGGGTTGTPEFTFPSTTALAGTFIYVASESTEFTNFFGFAPDYVNGAANINGDDAIEVYENGTVVDVFGDVNTDGTGETWEYLDGWAYRMDDMYSNGGTFNDANWNFSGIDALDGETDNGTAATPFPLGSFYADHGVSPWSGPFAFQTLSSCPGPTNLASVYIGGDTIVFNWDSIGTPGSHNIQYGMSGFAIGSGMMMSTTDTTDTITGLMPNVTSDIYVQADCGGTDTGAWVGPLTVTSEFYNDDVCGAMELPVDGMDYYFDNTGATAQTGEVAPPGTGCGTEDGWCNSTLDGSTWFTFVAPGSGNVNISGSAAAFDGQVAVYDDTADCNDWNTFYLLGANDDNPYGSGFYPEINICGLTPGNTYYIQHDPYSGQGAYSLRITEVSAPFAGNDNTISVCETDTVDLNAVVGGPDAGGSWMYTLNPNAIVDDTTFDATVVPDGMHDVTYIVSIGCDSDTAVATLEVLDTPNSGTAVSPFEVCNNSMVALVTGLTGSVDLGGSWSDDDATGGLNGDVFDTDGISAGSYDFTYTASNDGCPDASTTVTVDVLDCTGINENDLSGFGLYPNPSQGSFFVTNSNYTGQATIEVLDAQGRVVYSETMTMTSGDRHNIELSNVEAGMYMVRVTNNEAAAVQTLIVK